MKALIKRAGKIIKINCYFFIDYDECKGNFHGCEHNCTNLDGGYNCTCMVGYRMNNKNFKKCDGIVIQIHKIHIIIMNLFYAKRRFSTKIGIMYGPKRNGKILLKMNI